MKMCASAAAVCKASYAEYYQVTGGLPTTPAQAGCSATGTTNSKARDLTGGEIKIGAIGTLANQLGTGIVFAMKPDCGGAGCIGTAPIKGWICSSSLGASTTIANKYLPSACRG